MKDSSSAWEQSWPPVLVHKSMAPAAEGCTPRKLGLTFKPPSLTVVYAAHGTTKLRRRNIPVRGLRAESEPADVARRLAQAHADLLAPALVPTAQLEKLMQRLVSSVAERALTSGQSLAPQRQVAPASQGSAAVPAWGGSGASPPPAAVAPDANLNALDTDELNAVKATMDVAFRARQLKPGDAGYEYDKRVDFGRPVAQSEWDDELEDFTSSEEEDLFGKKDDLASLLA